MASEVRLGYYALTVAILAECRVEMAFEKLQSEHPDLVRNNFTPADKKDMRKLKASGVTWAELGEIYCIPPTTVYGLIRTRNRPKGGNGQCRALASAVSR